MDLPKLGLHESVISGATVDDADDARRREIGFQNQFGQKFEKVLADRKTWMQIWCYDFL
jgi:hypothetical protein